MSATWEYKVTTVKHGGGGLQLTLTPTDEETRTVLNRRRAGLGTGQRRLRQHCAADGAVFQTAALSGFVQEKTLCRSTEQCHDTA
jgi:hypothetical protein